MNNSKSLHVILTHLHLCNYQFFVEDNELVQREELPVDYSADYWEKRYTMRPERIPVFLNEHAQTILRTGKYFNVIRQCGAFIESTILFFTS